MTDEPEPAQAVAPIISHPWLGAGFLLLLASALRLYRLDGQLWFDEISALRGYRKPFLETLTTFPEFFPNPLYELAAHASLVLFGESAFSIRLPAALFGIASVLIFYRLARRALGSAAGLLAATLLAVSYHHIFYSQDARGYTTYLFFALLATDRLADLLGFMRWRTALGYAASVALAAYAHAFGIFVLAGQMPVAVFIAWRRRESSRRAAPTPGPIIGTAALGTLMTLVLYAPILPTAVTYAFTEAVTEGHGPRVTGLLPELIEGLRASFGAWPVLLIGLALGGIGILDLLRRQPVLLALLVAPIALSGIATLLLGVGVHPRYFLLALPVGYLVGASGVSQSARWIASRTPWMSALHRPAPQMACGALVTMLACLPLLQYYGLPKQDYQGALREVRRLADVDDRVVAADLAGRAITAYYDPDLPAVDDLQGLLQVEASGRRVWVLTTLERAMAARAPDLLAHLRQRYRRVEVLAGTVGDGALRIYMRAPESR